MKERDNYMLCCDCGLAVKKPKRRWRGARMMSKYIFPLTLIILDALAAIVYVLHEDYKMALYWTAAAVLNCCVTF